MIQILSAMTVIDETTEKSRIKREKEQEKRTRIFEKESQLLLNFNWLIFSYI